MDAANKSRRNAFLMGVGLLLFGILQLLVAHSAYKTHRMIPAGEAEGQFMTPTQGFIIAGIAFAFAAYAFARAVLAKRDDI